ncbi:hypothetical protein R6Q57_019248 [Mikania cordata]
MGVSTRFAFRVTRQPRVPPQETGVAVAAKSSTGNVFGFKALRTLRLEDLWIPIAYVKTFEGPPHGFQVERDKLNKYGRPLLGCTIKPKLGLSAKNYGRSCYECLRGGLDFTKYDENVNSQSFMRWRDCFVFCAEAISKAQAETGEIKGHYLNATVGNCNEMMKRTAFARELGVSIVMHDYLTGGSLQILPWLIISEIMVYFFTSTAQCMQLLIDRRIMFGGGTLGHPWGNAPGAVANQVDLEACVQARNEGRDLATEGNEIIREAAKWSPELAAACEVWKEIKFEFQAMDTLDTEDKD